MTDLEMEESHVTSGTPTRLSVRAGRKFGLTVGIAFALLGGLLWWRHREIGAAVGWTLGGLLIVGALVAPTRLGPLERAWMGLAHVISKVTTPIFMGIVYLVAVTPIGLLMRLLGKNPIAPREAGGSFWQARTGPRGTMGNQF